MSRPLNWQSRLCMVLVVIAGKVAVGAELELSIVDEAGRRLPGRVLIQPEDGEPAVPEGATELRIGKDRWFMSDGLSVLDVPSGRVLVRVEHGLEYRRFKQHIQVTGPRTTQIVEPLGRPSPNLTSRSASVRQVLNS